MAKRETIVSPYSKFREEIIKKLKELNYLKDFQIEGDKVKKINIELFYKDGVPAITDVKLISKLGRKVYVSYRDLKSVVSGMGYSILSTSKGIMTDRQAKKEKIGGELLFNIW